MDNLPTKMPFRAAEVIEPLRKSPELFRHLWVSICHGNEDAFSGQVKK
jgi:hypothetical protein